MATTVTIALVPDTRAVARWTETGPGRCADTVLVDVAPMKNPDLRDVADAVLAGLGKDERLTALKRLGVPLATGWLSLGERTEAVILDAGALPDTTLTDALTWFAGLDMSTWLLFAVGPDCDHDALGERIDTLAEAWGAAIVDHDDVKAHWPSKRSRPAPKPRDSDDLPMLPRVDGIAFREAMHADFDAETFARIDADCARLVAMFRTEIESFKGPARSRKFANLLRNLMHDTGSTERLHLLVRAAQIAAVVEGFQVAVDPIAFAGGCAVVPRRGQAVEGGWWERLDLFRDPDVGATAALYLAGLDPADLLTLTLASVTATGPEELTVSPGGGDPVVVNGEGLRYLKALVAWRVAAGAGPDDFLLTTHRKAAVAYPHARALMRAPEEVGVSYTPTPLRKVQPTAPVWLARFGIVITKLTYTPVES